MVEQIKAQVAAEALEKVNVLLVDDQPDKLLSYEVILGQLNENLVKTSSAREALQFLLKNDVAVLLIDVCMPDLDGFQLAAMIREHPRFAKTAIIFISAIHLTEMDRLRGYEMGAVDYVPVPVIPEVLRAKVKVFVELFRKKRGFEPQAYTLYSYAALQIIKQAAEQAKSLDPKKVADVMHSGKVFDTVLGEVAFDKKGDVTGYTVNGKPKDRYVLYTWKKGPDGKLHEKNLAKVEHVKDECKVLGVGPCAPKK